jgi:hypothetical protein
MRYCKLIVTAAAMLLHGCERDGGVIGEVHIADIRGAFLIEDDDRTTPLTRVRHSVYYAVNGKRSLIFEGTGGSKPALSLLTPDTILVRYCGGSIDRAASFLEKLPTTEGNPHLFKVQPITSVGVEANGRPIC